MARARKSATYDADRAREWRRRQWKPTLVDLAVLSLLPEEGSRLGLHHIGRTVPAMTTELQRRYGDDAITTSMVAGRCASLKVQGYATAVQLVPISNGIGWQITKQGAELLNENRDQLPEEVSGSGNTST